MRPKIFSTLGLSYEKLIRIYNLGCNGTAFSTRVSARSLYWVMSFRELVVSAETILNDGMGSCGFNEQPVGILESFDI